MVTTYTVRSPTTTDQPRVELLLDDWRGVHIPRDFAEEWSHGWHYEPRPSETEAQAAKRYEDDIAVLLAGVDASEWYWEVWDDVLRDAVGKPVLGPDFEGAIESPNPFAGWVLDQGGAEDSCLRAYHPDDHAAVFGDDDDGDL